MLHTESALTVWKEAGQKSPLCRIRPRVSHRYSWGRLSPQKPEALQLLEESFKTQLLLSVAKGKIEIFFSPVTWKNCPDS